MGRNFSQNKFDGALGEDLDFLWSLIRQDQLVSSPSVKVNRTSAGTFIKGQPVQMGGNSAPPPPEDLTGQQWRIDGDQPITSSPHIVNVRSEDGSRTMRVLGVPLGRCLRSDSPCNVPPHSPTFTQQANHFWPERVNLIEVPTSYPVFEWANPTTTFTSTWLWGPEFFWWYGTFREQVAQEWYLPISGGYRPSIYRDQHFAVVHKLATPFTDQAGRIIDYYLPGTVSPINGLPDQWYWQRAI